MKTVLIAMHLVACEPDLLICQDVSMDAKRWQDMGTCQNDRDHEMQKARGKLPEWAVVMSRCRYLIGRDLRTAPMF
ncbi:hypothetical protein [uncultured Roseibium sp.]|uniref:hypothetical protein n=1 Tax=uncultured Roseibium sp. TaxID=1936171 RepID=UPI00260E9E5B|nr:hypothetical protein [uncultured Roseibium sp.]